MTGTASFKAALGGGRPLLGTSLDDVNHPGMVYAAAVAGADFVFIDLEHTPRTIESVASLVLHARAAGVPPVVRPRSADPSAVVPVLDAGCDALLVPNVRSVREVRAVLEAARYWPEGRRGVGLYGGVNTGYRAVPDIEATAAAQNAELTIGLVIETAEAVDSLDQILAEDVDFALLGPADLAMDLRHRGALTKEAIARGDDALRSACRACGVAYGASVASLDGLDVALARGADLVIYGGVLHFVREALAAAEARIRSHPRVEPSTASLTKED